MLNKCCFIGRLTRDIDLRYTENGLAIGKFTIAVDDGYKDKKETDFIDIVSFGKLAENIANFIGKGRLVAVVGKLKIRNYEAQDGSKRKSASINAEDIKFLDKAKSDQDFDPNDLDIPF